MHLYHPSDKRLYLSFLRVCTRPKGHQNPLAAQTRITLSLTANGRPRPPLPHCSFFVSFCLFGPDSCGGLALLTPSNITPLHSAPNWIRVHRIPPIAWWCDICGVPESNSHRFFTFFFLFFSFFWPDMMPHRLPSSGLWGLGVRFNHIPAVKKKLKVVADGSSW